jgi:hypothetical protein
MNRYDEFREQVLNLGDSVTRFAVVLAALELNVFEALDGEVLRSLIISILIICILTLLLVLAVDLQLLK